MFIHARGGDDVELVCVVHAHPRAEVRWLKDGVDVTERAEEAVHNRHALRLRGLKEAEMGNYSCEAMNKWGDASGVIEISGKEKWRLRERRVFMSQIACKGKHILHALALIRSIKKATKWARKS